MRSNNLIVNVPLGTGLHNIYPYSRVPGLNRKTNSARENPHAREYDELEQPTENRQFNFLFFLSFFSWVDFARLHIISLSSLAFDLFDSPFFFIFQLLLFFISVGIYTVAH